MKLFIKLLLLTIFSINLLSCETRIENKIFPPITNDAPTGLDEPQIYKLEKQSRNSDFNLLKLKNLDDYNKDEQSLKEIFEPVKGNYNYYRFLSIYTGRNLIFPGDDLKDSIRTFHDVLIVKTDKENNILDAFQYTLEWGEEPLQYDLFRCSNKNMKLKDNMNIADFKFVRAEYSEENDKLFNESGVLRFK